MRKVSSDHDAQSRHSLTHIGDGSTDDTEAINAAISSGDRCGLGCDSSTTTPALVYFPPGTYVVSKPIIQYYYTQLVGDALDLPVLKASADFTGMAVIDSDPYTDTGENWYTNQNNFFRSIRNFVIDLTGMPPTSGTGIHWQVGQATSLQNIRFEMVRGGDNNVQQGIFMDNGSGGFMSDLVFNGGNYGMFLGNQQFTTRNLTFNGCNTAMFMNWNWAWTFKSITVNDCGVALNMSNNPPEMTVGSVMILDSSIATTRESIVTAWTQDSNPIGGGVLVLDNVDFTNSQVAVAHIDGSTVLEGGSVVDSWVQGNTYTPPGNSGVVEKRHASESLSEGDDVCPAPVVVTVTSTTMVPARTPVLAPSPAAGSVGAGLQNSESVASTETRFAASSAMAPVIASNGNVASVGTTSVASAAETSTASGSAGSTSATRTSPTNQAVACSSTPTVEKSRTQGPVQRPPKPSGLLDSNGRIFERTRPFYNNVPASSFVSVKDAGAKGDGKTDDTAAIQKVFDSATSDQIVYFDHGAYLITSTIKVPKNIKITGEIWPLLMATGEAFQDEENPIPMLQIGEPGDVGDVEISDLILETKGPAPGAILMQWNVAGSSAGSAGMWDVHFRVGGSAGTELQSDRCAKTPDVTTTPDPECRGAFMLFHVTEQASVYVENSWFWVSDHELDLDDYKQINIYNGRGVLIESQNPVWFYGTGSEHNQLYNYQLQNAKNVFMGLIQTETPYVHPLTIRAPSSYIVLYVLVVFVTNMALQVLPSQSQCPGSIQASEQVERSRLRLLHDRRLPQSLGPAGAGLIGRIHLRRRVVQLLRKLRTELPGHGVVPGEHDRGGLLAGNDVRHQHQGKPEHVHLYIRGGVGAGRGQHEQFLFDGSALPAMTMSAFGGGKLFGVFFVYCCSTLCSFLGSCM